LENPLEFQLSHSPLVTYLRECDHFNLTHSRMKSVLFLVSISNSFEWVQNSKGC
jgi:hypothetical protein